MTLKNKKINNGYILAYIIPFIVVFLSFVFNGFAPFGSLDIMSSSKNEEFATYLYKLSDYIHNNYSGSDIRDFYYFYLTDPTNLIVALFPRNMISTLINIFYCIKIAFAGLSFFYYINNKEKTATLCNDNSNISLTAIKLALSAAYALSTFFLSYGANILWLTVIALFPLIIHSLDELLVRHSWHKYTILMCFSYLICPLMSIVIFIFSILYYLTYNYKSLEHFVKASAYKFIADVISIGASLFVLYPAFTSSSAQKALYNKLPYNIMITSFWDVFRSLLSLEPTSASTDTSYGIDTYSGIIVVLGLFLYLLKKDVSIYTKIRRLVLIIILFASTNIIGLNSIFNAFYKNDLNICIWGFELIFVLLITSYDVLSDINKTTIYKILICFFLTEAVIVLAMIFSDTYLTTRPFIASLEFVFVYMILFAINLYLPKKSNIIKVLIGATVLIEVILTFTTNIRNLASSKIIYTNTLSCRIYETEKAISNSAPNSNTIFYDTNDNNFNPIFNTINGIDYVITEQSDTFPDACLDYIGSINNLHVYKNKYSIKGNIYANSEITNWTYTKTSPYKSSTTLLNYITDNNYDNIFTKIDCTMDNLSGYVSDDANNTNKEKHYLTFKYSPKSEGHLYSSYFSPRYLGYSNGNDDFTETYNITSKNIYQFHQTFSFYRFDINEYEQAVHQIIDNSNRTQKDTNANHYLIVSIGSKPNKTYYINNKRITPLSIDNLVWIIPVSDANSTIRVSDDDGTLLLRITISLIFILLLLACLFSSKVKHMAEQIKERKVIRIIYNFVLNNYTYLSSMIITSCVILLSCMFKSCLPFGDASAMISDGYVQTYPGTQSMINTLSLKSLVPSTLGFGTMIFSCGYDPIASTIGTIIQLIYRTIIQTNDGIIYSTIISSIYLVLSGPSMIYYLTHRCSEDRLNKTNYLLIPLSLFYSLSSYMIGFFVFNNFMYGLYLPLIVLSFEKMIYEKKPAAYMVLLSLFIIRGYYTAFLLCMFLVLLFFIQDFTGFKDFINKGIRFAIASIISAGIAISTILPALSFVSNSRYLENDTASKENQFSFYSSIINTISQYKAGIQGVVTSTENNMVNIYCGLIPILFLLVYLSIPKIKKSIRIRKFLLILVYIYAFGNELFNYVFHGFHFQSNVPNRYAIFFVFILISMCADVLIYWNKIPWKKTVYSFVISGISLIICWIINPQKELLSLSVSILFVCIYCSIILSTYRQKQINNKIKNLLLYISVLEIVTSSLLTFSSSIGRNPEELYYNNLAISKINKSINNSNDIYTAETITNSFENLNMGGVTGFNTLSGFSSSLDNSKYNMAMSWELFASDNIIKYGTGNPLADMMLHLKYQFIDSDNDEVVNSSIYKKKLSYNNIDVYENPYYLPLGFATPKELLEWSGKTKYDFDSVLSFHNAFCQTVCGKPLYTPLISSDMSESFTSDNNIKMNTEISDMNSYGTYDLNVKISIDPDSNINGKLYLLCETEIVYIGDSESKKDFDFNVYNYASSKVDKLPTIYIAELDETALNELHSILSANTLQDIQFDSTSIKGNIYMPNDQTLYIALPYYDNLTVYVDGKEIQKFEYLSGIGINPEPGQHKLEIKWHNKMIPIELTLTLLFIFGGIIFTVICYRRGIPSPVQHDADNNE